MIGMSKDPAKYARARRQRGEIAALISTQRDQLQRRYDWISSSMLDEDRGTLYDLIQHMSQVIGVFKQ